MAGAGRISAAARRHRPRTVYDIFAAVSFAVILLGGTALAANTIGSGDVIDNSLRSRDIQDGTIVGRDVGNGGLTGADLAPQSVPGSRLSDGSVGSAKIANNSLTGVDIAENTLKLPEGPRGNLPRGVTLRGAFRVGGGAYQVGVIATQGVSFIYTLASAPTPHFIAADTTPPAECPGTVALPKAAPGHLCVYETYHSANVATSQKIGDPVANASPGASRFGFQYSIQALSAGSNMASSGTWAVTSP